MEVQVLHTNTTTMVVNVHRMEDGQHVQKMLRAADNMIGKQNKTNKRQTGCELWQEGLEQISSECFPALGQEKQQKNGKYLKISVENKEKNINDAHPIQLGQILKQYFDGHTEQRRSKNCLIL